MHWLDYSTGIWKGKESQSSDLSSITRLVLVSTHPNWLIDGWMIRYSYSSCKEPRNSTSRQRTILVHFTSIPVHLHKIDKQQLILCKIKVYGPTELYTTEMYSLNTRTHFLSHRNHIEIIYSRKPKQNKKKKNSLTINQWAKLVKNNTSHKSSILCCIIKAIARLPFSVLLYNTSWSVWFILL